MNDAIARFSTMVQQSPDNELALFSLGKALFDQGDYTAAREHLRSAMVHQPDWMAAQILLARCDLLLGDKHAARSALEKAKILAQKQGHVGPLAQVEELMKALG
jgi:predicted Zn-dependent protease